MRALLVSAALNGFIAVAMGAFGAHALQGKLSPDNRSIYETAAHYHLVHALAILGSAILIGQLPAAAKSFHAAGWLFNAGIALFSGSLYMLAITNVRILGAITPFGGFAFLAGWAWLALGAIKLSPRAS